MYSFESLPSRLNEGPAILGAGQCAKCNSLADDVNRLVNDNESLEGQCLQISRERDDAHRQVEQLQQQLIELTAEKNRLLCNVDYQQLGVRVVDSMAGSSE